MFNLDDLFSSELISPEKGYGVRLRRSIDPSQHRLTEKPIFSYIHLYSKKSCLACDNCFMNVGSLVENLNHVLRIEGKCIPKELEKEVDVLKRKFPDLEGVKYFKCKPNCDLVFCSKECLNDSTPTHLILCELMDNLEKDKWKLFKRHSIKTHENFYFAGLIYVHVLYDSIYNKTPVKSWIERLGQFYSIKWDQLYTLGLDSTNPQHIAEESFNMLDDCLTRFKALSPENEEDLNLLFSVDFYLKLLGMMDLVCVDIEIENPLNGLLYNLNKDPVGALLIKSLSKELGMIYQTVRGTGRYKPGTLGVDASSMDEIIESKELFPEIMGLGLFNHLSRMNHSCQPNLEVEYLRNNIANVIPLHSISQGEEATISYIDEKDVFENRQRKLLKNYGFKCNCAKCVLEGPNNL